MNMSKLNKDNDELLQILYKAHGDYKDGAIDFETAISSVAVMAYKLGERDAIIAIEKV